MFSLSKENSSYKTVVFDVIRIFLGDYKWEDLDNTDYPEIKITLSKNFLKLEIDNNICEEKLENYTENDIKRKIKKLLYLLIKENYKNRSDSWGILTGIRPTKIVHRMIDQNLEKDALSKILTDEYLLTKEKANLLLEITKKQRDYFLSEEESYKKIAIYISIPFCPSICSYCTFGSYLLSKYHHLLENYLKNLFYELDEVLKVIKERKFIVDKIYIGGGTPSILNSMELKNLFDIIKKYVSFENVVEFSFEAGRPDTINKEKLIIMKEAGVTRISINPQIMNDKVLKKIGREHLTQEIRDTYKTAREIGFTIINMDLIMGIENDSNDFIESLKEVIKLEPENITIHSLAFKRKSIMKLDGAKLFSNAQLELFELGIDLLRKAAYEPYYLYKQKLTVGGQENIGFSEKNKFSPYNIQMIEERQIILGFGVGASSKLLNQKDLTLENVFNPKDLYYYHDKINEVVKKKTDYLEKISKEYKNGN